jgi:hypothetical protein
MKWLFTLLTFINLAYGGQEIHCSFNDGNGKKIGRFDYYINDIGIYHDITPRKCIEGFGDSFDILNLEARVRFFDTNLMIHSSAPLINVERCSLSDSPNINQLVVPAVMTAHEATQIGSVFSHSAEVTWKGNILQNIVPTSFTIKDFHGVTTFEISSKSCEVIYL